MSEQERMRRVMDLIPADWDRKPVSLIYEIRGFLENVKDQGTSMDSGTDGTCGDLWVTIQGIEYFITVKKSNAQLAKEGMLAPWQS
jgi:hypothetical protein